MKFPLSSGEWIFTSAAVYLIVNLINLFVYKFASVESIQMVWILITALPLFVPMNRLVAIKTFWS